MRIALLSTDPGIPWGAPKGAAVHLAEMASALTAVGAEVLVIAPEAGEVEGAPRGAVLEPLPGPGKGASAAERLAGEPERTGWLESRVREFGAEALYERFALHTAAGAAAARALGLVHLVELNAPLREEAARYRSLEEPVEAERLEREVMTGAQRIFCVSSPLVDYALERGARRVELAPNAVALERFEGSSGREPRARGSDDGRPVAVFAGALRPWHGVEAIAEAWRLLGADAPRLLVAGEGPGRAALAAAGAELVGVVAHERMPSVLRAADIGLAPYASDAPSYFSPLKLFEYMAAGLAVVAGDLPGVRDVADRETAVLIPPGDAEALARAVADLAADAPERRRMGEAARALVGERHSWRQRARRVLQAAGEAEVPTLSVR